MNRCQWESSSDEWWGKSDMFCPSEATTHYRGVPFCARHRGYMKKKLQRLRKEKKTGKLNNWLKWLSEHIATPQ